MRLSLIQIQNTTIWKETAHARTTSYVTHEIRIMARQMLVSLIHIQIWEFESSTLIEQLLLSFQLWTVECAGNKKFCNLNSQENFSKAIKNYQYN